jgi:hypothetical protein
LCGPSAFSTIEGILFRVRWAFIPVVVVVFAATATLAIASQSERPRLATLDLAPVTVRGVYFRAREQVRVVLRMNGDVYSRRITTTLRGRFVVRYLSVTAGPCTPYTVSATGSKGSRAALKVFPECPAP